MGTAAPNKQEHFADFDTLGEAEVRRRVDSLYWGSTNDAGHVYAVEWLWKEGQSRSAEAERRRVASHFEQIRIARSAKNAAWAAAIAAIIAAICATVAIGISVLK